eukprot:scaffold246467_cov33-Cyclotella_meneghiniana.AAC.1
MERSIFYLSQIFLREETEESRRNSERELVKIKRLKGNQVRALDLGSSSSASVRCGYDYTGKDRERERERSVVVPKLWGYAYSSDPTTPEKLPIG